MLELDRVRCDEFVAWLNQDFGIATPAGNFVLQLFEARPLGSRWGTDRQPFSLMFTGPASLRLPQGIYKLSHSQLGEMEIFLVQIAADQTSSTFEAVFN